MQLPDELGAYVQSFLRPTRPLFFFLQRLPPTPALQARMDDLNLEFERINWLRYYADEPTSTGVVVFSYTGATRLLHTPLSKYARAVLVRRMREATGDLCNVHATTCETLGIDYSLLCVEN